MSTQSIAALVGAFLGPILVDGLGLAGLTGACAVSYLCAAVLVGMGDFQLSADTKDSPTSESTAEESTTPLRKQANDRRGSKLAFVLANQPFARTVLLWFGAANLFAAGLFVIYPLYTRVVLHAGGTTYAGFEAAFGIGMLIGAFSGARLPGRPTVLGSVLIAGSGVALTLPTLSTGRMTVNGCLLLSGWCVGALNVVFVSLFQRVVPAADKPAFFAVMQAGLTVTFPVSAVAFGFLGDAISPRMLCLIQGIGLLPAALGVLALRGREPQLTKQGEQ
jgi:predicted MFS family arabinose efflux permease